MPPNQNAAQGFHHIPQDMGNYYSTQAAFFENISRGVWYYCQYVLRYCVSFTFITFIRYSLTPCKCLHISWDRRTFFENLWNHGCSSTNYTLKIIFQMSQFLRQRRVSLAVIGEFQKQGYSCNNSFTKFIILSFSKCVLSLNAHPQNNFLKLKAH